MDKAARREITDKLNDAAIKEISDLMDAQYKAGYEYAEFRRNQSAKCRVPEKPAAEVLAVVLAPKDVKYFRALLRAE